MTSRIYYAKAPTADSYRGWTYGAYLCWKSNGDCSRCSEKRICDSVKPITNIPYDMKPMKYAMLNSVKRFGTDGLDEKFSNLYGYQNSRNEN